MAVIGIFDSGVGGLSVFKEVKRLMPDASYVYYGDNANCPYGPKGAEFIIERARTIAGILMERDVDAIVIACNTATSYAAAVLREKLDIPVIGMVPAVKPAALSTQTGVVGVLATMGTLNGPLYQHIRDTYGNGARIMEHIGVGFVELVEAFELSGPKAELVVRESIEDMVLSGADSLVLGCTHYPFLKNTIEKVANELKPANVPHVAVIDPAPAVARHLRNVLLERGCDLAEPDPFVELLSSGSDEVLVKLYTEFVK